MAEQERFDRIERSIERGFERLDGKIEKIQEDVSALRESVGKIEGVIEGKLPHLATEKEVEEAKHEATKAKYSVFVSIVAVLTAMASLFTRLWTAKPAGLFL